MRHRQRIPAAEFSIYNDDVSLSITISEDLLQSARMSAAELRQEIGVLLFEREKLTLAQASRFAEMSRFQFQNLLASRGLSVHYDIEEFEQDLETLRDLGRL